MTKKHSRARYSEKQIKEARTEYRDFLNANDGKYIHQVDFNCSQEEFNKDIKKIFNI